MRRTGIGIDFGTTNSAAAVFDGTAVRLVDLEDASAIMPSATYIDRDLQTRTGVEAVERYVADNTGRRVELVPEVIGEAALALTGDPGGRAAPQLLVQKVYGAPALDSGLRGRLFHGTKRLLGHADIRRLSVFDHPFRLVALITPILLRIVRTFDAGGDDAKAACVGHPVNFEGRGAHRNTLALTRLGEACHYAGIGRCRMVPEPIAAAVGFLHERPDAGDRVLTVDFGGGTLDFSILGRRDAGTGFRVLSTHGVALGGDHIDRCILRELLFPLLGQGERWRRRGAAREIETRFPFEDYEEFLLNWPVTYLLNQNRYTTAVQSCIESGGPARHKFRRLRELIQQNLGYLVFQAIKAFKAELSVAREAVLDIPEIDIEVRMTRPEFERLIAEPLREVERAVDTTLETAGMSAGEFDVVLRTGGSSLIPAVRRILDERFPGRVVEHDPFTSVAAGLAIADYYDLPELSGDSAHGIFG